MSSHDGRHLMAGLTLKFIHSERMDMASNNGRVNKAASAVGLEVTKQYNWSVLWSFHTAWDQPLTIKRKRETTDGGKGQYVINHIPGTIRLASKSHLPSFMKSVGIASTTPITYLMPEDIDNFSSAVAKNGIFDQHGLPVWLLKKKTHRGVRALTNASREYLANEKQMMVQRRVHPLLLRGLRRSFDIGIYVLVSSIKPLRVYVFEKALVRICEKEYPTSAAGFDDPATFVISKYTPIWQLPFFYPDLAKCEQSAACALRRALDSQGHSGAGLFKEMEGVVMKLLGQMQPSSIAGARRMEFAPEAMFELFRFDFMVDSSARPILTEVNFSPNLVGAHPEDERTKDELLRDTLRIVTRRLQMPMPKSATAEEVGASELSVLGSFRKMEIPNNERNEHPHEQMPEILR